MSGAVSTLSMAAGGSLIVAGTESGNIAGFDKNGNLSGNYASYPENRQTAGIRCRAVSDNGTIIAAGTDDGKILFLDSRGGLMGSFNAHEFIRHIAMSSDGSVVVATSDERVYAFSPGSFPKINSAPSRTMTPEKNIPEVLPVQTPVLHPPLLSRLRGLRLQQHRPDYQQPTPLSGPQPGAPRHIVPLSVPYYLHFFS